MESSDLYTRLREFQFQTGNPQLSFADRLARDNGWTAAYTRLAVTEYLKFVYLCASGTQMHTPSDAVDQVWHLHLIYTRSYWDDLCGDVLGRPLHHQPTRGGYRQGAHWAAAYQHTLERYREVFGDTPPADIWPAPADRFRDAARFRRVNTARFWLLPRRATNAAAGAAALGLVALPAYAASGNVAVGVLIAVIAALVVGVAWFALQHPGKSSGSAGCGAAGTGGTAAGGGSKSSADGDGGGDGGSGCGGGCGG